MNSKKTLIAAIGILITLLLPSCVDTGYYAYQTTHPISSYPGSSLTTLPHGYTRIYVDNTPYWHHGNRWYRYNSGKYIACSRPAGYRGHTSYTRYSRHRYTTPRYHDSHAYYHRKPNYYQRSNHHYRHRNHSSNRYKSHEKRHRSNRDLDKHRAHSDRSPKNKDHLGPRTSKHPNRKYTDTTTRRPQKRDTEKPSSKHKSPPQRSRTKRD